jgi:uncharacterized protein (TIGR02145 family)
MMKWQKSLVLGCVYVFIATVSFSFSYGQTRTTNPNPQIRTSNPSINTPPNAFFTVNPMFGTIDTVFQVDASGSTENQNRSSTLQVRYDWENDGTWTDWTETMTSSHQYSSVGTKTIKLEMKDTGGLIDTETKQVTVSTGVITVKDIDGNIYHAVQIGDQFWMVENLKVTRYRNGDAIPNITDDSEWDKLTNGAYCQYDNNEENGFTYGLLYNWFAVDDSRNIAPEGWHVPSDAEWKKLIDYFDGDAVAGGKMKEIGTTHWSGPNIGASNASGFSALPGGYRINRGLRFGYVGLSANFWSSTKGSKGFAWGLSIYNSHPQVERFNYMKQYGLSVCCIKD